MVTHLVCWKYKTETSKEECARHLALLLNLPKVIANISSFEAGFDILHLERSYDTGLVATYPDRKALEDYTIHPAHQEVAAFGKQISANVVSVDFET